MQINISTNAKELVVHFSKIEEGLIDFTIPLKKSAIYMLSSISRNFSSQGRPIPWIPLSPMTLELRRKGKSSGSPQILRDTGELFNSIVVSEPQNNTISVGTNLKKAPKLQYGGENIIPSHTENVKSYYRRSKGKRTQVKAFSRKMPTRKYKIPARPFIMFQNEDVEVLQELFIDYVKKVIKDNANK